MVQEDLDEQEARKGAAIYSRQPEVARRKHEAHVERLAKKARADEKARQPRKPRSAYQFFAEARRPALTLEMAGCAISELSKRLAVEWKECADDERGAHAAAAAADLTRYLRECEANKVDPGKAALMARGPAPALDALGFFKGQSEAVMGQGSHSAPIPMARGQCPVCPLTAWHCVPCR
jgi:hypothetical protein